MSGWPLLRNLKRAGLKTQTFSYHVSLETFDAIQARLAKHVSDIAQRGKYILVGHSLGGVLIRAAVNSLEESIPKPHHVFLLGSPIQPARLAQKLKSTIVFRAITRDCGDLLASETRMKSIGSLNQPVTSVIGVKGLPMNCSPFQGEENDGVVSVSEVSADWLTDVIRVPIIHTLLPSSRYVAQLMLDRIDT